MAKLFTISLLTIYWFGSAHEGEMRGATFDEVHFRLIVCRSW